MKIHLLRPLLAAAMLLPLMLAATPPAATPPVHNRFAEKVIQTPAALVGVDYSPDGQRIVTCGRGHNVVVWDVASGKAALTRVGHTDDVVSVKYSPNGRYIASGGADNALILWDALTGDLLRKDTDHTACVRDVAFSPDSKLLASAGWDGQTLVFDAFGGQRLATLRASATAPAGAAALPQAQRQAQAYDSTKTTNDRSDNVTSVAFSPDGTELLTASGDHFLRTWDTRTWQLKVTLGGHAHEVWDARYAPNGRYAVSGAWDKTARVWDLTNGSCVRTVAAHASEVWAAAFSPDGQFIATGGDRQVKVWDAALGTLVGNVSADDHTAAVENLVFSPEGRHLASVSRDGSLRLWHVPTTDERVLNYADQETEEWARQGKLEKAGDYQRRLAGRYQYLKKMQAEAQARILVGFEATANWQPFELGRYDADAQRYVLTSKNWSEVFYVKVSSREAPRFRDAFRERRYSAPVFEFVAGKVVLKTVDLTLAYDGSWHVFEMGR